MKTILFRGFNVCDDGNDTVLVYGESFKGKWVYGNFVDPCNIVYEENGHDDVMNRDDVPVIHDYAVLPETVGQRIGNDSTGRNVYEFDVVKGKTYDDEEITGIVIWDVENYCYVVRELGNICTRLSRFSRFEVIGNRFTLGANHGSQN